MERRTRGMANRTGRTMNSAMNISLPVELHEQLRDLAWQERSPFPTCAVISSRRAFGSTRQTRWLMPSRQR